MTQALPIIYSFRRCPYAIRARLALLQAAIPVELREVDLKRKPAELLACSAEATVPVLDLGGGQVLTQSLDIMHWALAQRDPAGWLPPADEPANAALLAANDGPFKQWLDRYKYAERHPQQPQAAWRDEGVRCLLAPLEARLQGAPFLGGARPCLTDVALFPFVRQFAAVDALWWTGVPWPATRHWLDHWQTSPLMTACVVKFAVWQTGDDPVRFAG
jgi:glutathione S-transferase